MQSATPPPADSAAAQAHARKRLVLQQQAARRMAEVEALVDSRIALLRVFRSVHSSSLAEAGRWLGSVRFTRRQLFTHYAAPQCPIKYVHAPVRLLTECTTGRVGARAGGVKSVSWRVPCAVDFF